MIDIAQTRSGAGELLEDYWAESYRPLASLALIAPILLVYELGILAQGPAAARNGADVWLRMFLDEAGFGQFFLLPVLTIGILLGWHYTTRQPWRLARGTLAGMVIECAALSVCLWLVLQIQGALLEIVASGIATPSEPVANLGASDRLCGLIGYLGAGVYEELLFRLMLLPAAAWILHRMGLSWTVSLVAAVVTTSLLFAAAHHIGPHGEPLSGFLFLFRFLAGAFFCILFIKRGFGIAAGTHAGYDILVGVFLASGG